MMRATKSGFLGVPRAHNGRMRKSRMRVKSNEAVYTAIIGLVFLVLLIIVTRMFGMKII